MNDPDEQSRSARSVGKLLPRASRSQPLDTDQAPARYRVGQWIDNEFEVLEELGHGAYARVYRVRNDVMPGEYALKVLPDGTNFDVLRREVVALQLAESPHVVKLIWARSLTDGQMGILFELLEGRTLEDHTRPENLLDRPEALGLIAQLLSALAVFHPDERRIAELTEMSEQGSLSQDEYFELHDLKQAGLVHRDIKPANLVLTASGRKLIDFNISSKVGLEKGTLSHTPGYLPPDLLALGTLGEWDVQPDLFATGVVSYQLLTGHHPYPDGVIGADQNPKDPHDFSAGLSDELAAFLCRACAAHGEDRFDTARSMLDALQALPELQEDVRAQGKPSRLEQWAVTGRQTLTGLSEINEEHLIDPATFDVAATLAGWAATDGAEFHTRLDAETEVLIAVWVDNSAGSKESPHIPLFALRFERSGALQFELPFQILCRTRVLHSVGARQLLAAKLGRAIAPADEIIGHQASGTATSPVRIPLSNFGDENNQERFVDELEHVLALLRDADGDQ